VDQRAPGPLNKVEALARWRESGVFDDRERAALEYAGAVTCSERTLDDELMARLAKHFDEDGIVELTGLIALQNLSTKFNTALDVPAQGLRRRLPLRSRRRRPARATGRPSVAAVESITACASAASTPAMP
jgi:hypothetical protein